MIVVEAAGQRVGRGELPEGGGEGDLLGRRQVLTTEEEHLVLDESPTHPGRRTHR